MLLLLFLLNVTIETENYRGYNVKTYTISHNNQSFVAIDINDLKNVYWSMITDNNPSDLALKGLAKNVVNINNNLVCGILIFAVITIFILNLF